MAKIWKASNEIVEQMKGLIGKHHPDLALISDEICVVFREKAGKSGGQPVYGRAFKVSNYVNVLGDTDYKFVVELGADVWANEFTNKQQEALLDAVLCSINCEEDANTGDMKCGVVKPDIQAFRANVERYGMWMPKPEDEESEEGSKDTKDSDKS